MKKRTIQYILSIILVLVLFIVGSIGVLIFPGLLKVFGLSYAAIPKAQLYKIHHTLGVLVIFLLFIHLILHWKWINVVSKKIIKIKQTKSQNKKILFNYIINIALLIVGISLVSTGIIKYPGLLNYFGSDFTNIPFYEVSLIHDWSGVAVIFLSIIHLILFIRKTNLFKKKDKNPN
jgi:hypothetical protein